jgi:transposase
MLAGAGCAAEAYEAFRKEEAGYDVDQPGKGSSLASLVPQVEQDENDPWWKELLDGIGQAWDNFTSGITQTLTDAANNLQATLTPTPTTQLRPTLTSTPTILLSPTFTPTISATLSEDEVWQQKVSLLEPTLATIAVPRSGAGRPRQKPQRLIADKAYDSDPLRTSLARRGIELIAPHRSNRKRPTTQDGRMLRRYQHRWKVERTFAWFGNFRRLVVRWEYSLIMYLAFFHLACLLITLNRL